VHRLLHSGIRSRVVGRVRSVVIVVTGGLVVLGVPGLLVGTAAPGGAALRGTVTVSAAASLAPALEDVAVAFERRHPGVEVRVNAGSSATLAAQIAAGAPVDVFAAADRTAMDAVVAAGATAARPTVLARNTLTIVVPPGNPGKVRGLRSLARVPIVALCAAPAPCGTYAARVLRNAGVQIREDRVTRGADATATLGAVEYGDADAAVVYATDARRAGRRVTEVPIPGDQNVTAVYPVAPLTTGTARTVAVAFVRFATSDAGRSVLVRHGFLAP